MSFLLEKEYEMLSNPDRFNTEIYISLEESKEIGFDRPRELSTQQGIWELGNGFKISVIFGYGSYGSDQGLFEMALLDENGVVDKPAGHLTEDQVEAMLQRMKKKHMVKE